MNFKKTNLFLALAAALVVFAACGDKKGPVVIDGKADFKLPTTLKLFQVKDGELYEAATTPVDTAAGTFSFNFTAPYSGYYAIGWNSQLVPNYKYLFYFKQGVAEELTVHLTREGYEVGGKPSKENKVMAEWHKLAAPVERQAIGMEYPRDTYVEFFPKLETLVAESQTWFNGKKTGNKAFDQLFEKTIPCDVTMWAVNFISQPNKAFPTGNDYAGTYYEKIDIAALTADTTLLSLPFGFRLMRSALPIQERIHGGSAPTMAQLIDRIGNQQLKELYIVNRILGMRSNEEIESALQQYASIITTPQYKQQIEELQAKIEAENAAMAAADFTFTDMKGKKVSFSDFKGKMVLIDIWATWCAPCRAQIPHLIELEKQYHGNKDIVFIGISSDKASDKAKWEKMVKDQKLPGIQLFAGGPEQIPAAYNMKGIPRFILFGKDGQVIEANAPAPSTKLLKPIIDKHLNK